MPSTRRQSAEARVRGSVAVRSAGPAGNQTAAAEDADRRTPPALDAPSNCGWVAACGTPRAVHQRADAVHPGAHPCPLDRGNSTRTPGVAGDSGTRKISLAEAPLRAAGMPRRGLPWCVRTGQERLRCALRPLLWPQVPTLVRRCSSSRRRSRASGRRSARSQSRSAPSRRDRRGTTPH